MMDEYEKIRDLLEQEIMAIQKSQEEHPERYSRQGKSYWEGNVAGLKWILGELADIHLSTQTASGEEK